jgi:hypothetical protein
MTYEPANVHPFLGNFLLPQWLWQPFFCRCVFLAGFLIGLVKLALVDGLKHRLHMTEELFWGPLVEDSDLTEELFWSSLVKNNDGEVNVAETLILRVQS